MNSLEQPILCVFIDSLRGITTFDENESRMRNVIQAVSSIVCDKYRACCAFVHHFKKGQAGDLLDKSAGSTAIPSSVQLVLSVLKNKESVYTRTVKEAKSNFISVPRRPTLQSMKIGNEVVIRQAEEATEETNLVQAEEFLLKLFHETPKILAVEVYEEGKQHGFSPDLLKKVKKQLGIESYKDDFDGPWVWKMDGI